jgi:NADH-quinone oxidoreductase subunit D
MTETARELPSQTMTITLGPSHPATHGTSRFIVELDGETIVRMDVEVGYLHRGFEKMCENVTYNQVQPYTDRLNYVSPLLNNVGFCHAVEKLAGIEAPERAQYIRVIMGELSRICDHLTCTTAMGMELGGFTVFFYCIEARDLIWDLVEETTGARLTTSYGRVGGVQHDLPEGFADKYRSVKTKVLDWVRDVDKMLTKNRIFIDRCRNTGLISKEDAISYAMTGPFLRSTGVSYDVRKHKPYFVYDRFDFEVPLGNRGDNFDRYLIRIQEIYQSFRIIDQALEQIPDGPFIIDDPRYALPPKAKVYSSIEGTINHFKLVMEGTPVPKGEAYGYTEGGNGELGFHITSDGSGRPYRVRVRPPCLCNVAALAEMSIGGFLADVIPTFDSMNMIGGEIDR